MTRIQGNRQELEIIEWEDLKRCEKMWKDLKRFEKIWKVLTRGHGSECNSVLLRTTITIYLIKGLALKCLASIARGQKGEFSASICRKLFNTAHIRPVFYDTQI